MFIELTDENNEVVSINIDKIISIYKAPNSDGAYATVVVVPNGIWRVKESYGAIISNLSVRRV